MTQFPLLDSFMTEEATIQAKEATTTTSTENIVIEKPKTPIGKKPKEYAQKLAAICLGAGIANLLLYHIEVMYALYQCSSVLPDASIGTQTIITVLGSFISYCLYQFGLKNSRNKYRIDADGQPFVEPPTDCSE